MSNLFTRLRFNRIRRKARQSGDPVQAYGILLDQATKKDLDLAIVSVFIGYLFTVVTGFPGSSPLFTAYLKDVLGLSNSAYGLVLTVPYITVLIQIPYSYYARCHNNIKPIFICFALISKLMYLVPAFLPLLVSDPDPRLSTIIIAGMMLVASTSNWIADSSLNTWFGSIIPNQIKGRYLSTRQTVFTIAALIFSVSLTVLLPFLNDYPGKYTLLFSLGVAFGCIDILIFFGIRAPSDCVNPYFVAPDMKGSFNLTQFLKPFRDKRYRDYLLFATSWSFAINLAGPYFNIYLLEDMRAPLAMQTILQQIIGFVATILFMRRIGRLNDSFGFKPILQLSCIVQAISPLTWLFTTPANYGIIGISNFFAGIFGPAIDLAILSLAIFLAPNEDRITYLAGKNVTTALLGFVPATMLGGFLSDSLQPVIANADIHFFAGHTFTAFHVLVLLSAGLRAFTALVFLPRLREAEDTTGISLTLKEVGSMLNYRVRRNLTFQKQRVRTIRRWLFKRK